MGNDLAMATSSHRIVAMRRAAHIHIILVYTLATSNYRKARYGRVRVGAVLGLYHISVIQDY